MVAVKLVNALHRKYVDIYKSTLFSVFSLSFEYWIQVNSAKTNDKSNECIRIHCYAKRFSVKSFDYRFKKCIWCHVC